MLCCFWCKCPLLQLSGETVPTHGSHVFCSAEHRAYYRAGLPAEKGGPRVAFPTDLDYAAEEVGRG